MAEGGNVPLERDVKDFKFQQLCRLRIGPSQSNLGLSYVQLVAASSKYGFVFIGFDKGLKVIQTAELSKIDQEHTKDRTTAVVEDYPVWSEIRLDGTISFVSLNSDELSLAVVVYKNNVFAAYIYDVRAFANKGSLPSAFLRVILTSSAGDTVTDLSWNPAQASMLSVVLSSGKVTLYNITDNLEICASTPEAEAATCVCWSPKGKQLVVGTKDGKLKQFDQQLVKKREWSCPDVLPTASYTVVGVTWLSTYSFLAAYITADATDSSEQPLVVLTNGSKDKPPVCENFEDICFGNGEQRQKRYSFKFLQNWDMVIASSSTACETGIIGKHRENKDVWERWNLDDSARAEMPLTDDHVDTYPIGAAIDYSSQFKIPTGDSSEHPPSPLLLMLTTDGVLVPYYMMYSHKEAVSLTAPPQPLQAVRARTAKGDSGLETDAAISSAPSRTHPVSVGPTSGPSFQFVTPQSTAVPPSGLSFSFVASKATVGSNTSTASSPLIGSKPGATAFSGSSLSSSAPQSSSGTTFNFSTKPQATFSINSQASTQPETTAPAAGYSFKTSVASGAQSSGFNFVAAGATSAASSSAPSSAPFSGFSQTSGFAVPSSTQSSGFAVPSSTRSSGFAVPSSTQSSGFVAPSASQSSGFVVQSTTQSSGFAVQSATQSSGFGVPTSAQSSGFPGLNFGNKGQNLNLGTAASSGSSVFKLTTTESSAPTAASTPKPAPFNFAKPDSSPAPTGPASTGVSVSQGPAPSAAAAAGLHVQPRVGGTTIEQASKPTSAFVGFLTPQNSAAVTTSLAQTSNEFRGFLPPVSTAAVPRPTVQQTTVGVPPAGMFRPPAPASQSQPPLVRPVVTASQTLVSRPMPTSASVPAGASLVQPGGEANTGNFSSIRSEASGASNVTEIAGSGAADEDTYLKSILEEIAHFEKEMRDFRDRTGGIDAVVGTKQEMLELKALSIDMDNFCTEVKATTKDQNKEVEEQKSLCLDLFAMTEECRLRNERNVDHQYHHLLKSRALDPASLDRLRQLQQQYQVVDQGIRNVDHILDQQWEEYQNSKKNKSRIKMPATDTLYRALKTNHNLILVQKDQLSTIERQLKELKLYKKSTWQTANTTRDSGRSNELLSLADSLLENTEDHSPRNSTVLSVTVNPNRQARLREHLTRRAVPRVKSTRPENLCMSKIVSTRRLQTSLVEPEPELKPLIKPTENEPRPTVQATRGRKAMTTSAIQAYGIGQPVQQAFRPPAPVNFPRQRVTTGFQQMPPVRQTMDPRFPGFGQTLATGQKSLGHIDVEDVTPPSSTGYDEDDDDDDEDDEEEEDDDESDDNSGVGFGLQYSVDSQESEISGKGFDMSTPKAALPAAINRNLFGTPSKAGTDVGITSTSKPVGGFSGFVTTTGSTSSSTTPVNVAKSSATTSTSGGFNFGNNTGAATFNFSASGGNKPNSSFSFGSSGSSTKTTALGSTTTSAASNSSTTKSLLGAAPKTTVTAPSSGSGAAQVFGGFKFGGGCGGTIGGGTTLGGSDGSGEVNKNIVESSPMLLKALSVEDSDTEDNTRNQQKSPGNVAAVPVSPASGTVVTTASQTGTGFNFSLSTPTGGAVVTTASQSGTGFNFSLSTPTENQQRQTSTSQAQPSSSTSGISATGTKGITGGLFGAKPSTAPGGIFVQPTSTESSFATSASSTVSGSLLGRMLSGEDNIGSAASSAGGIFSQPANTSSENTFVPTTTVGSGLFGQTPSSTTSSTVTETSGTVSTTSGIFSQPSVPDVAPTSTTGSSAHFGHATTTTASVSVADGVGAAFDQPPAITAAATTSESTSIFGQPTSSNSTTTGIFSTPSSNTSTGIFGQAPNVNSSAFGSKAETTASTTTTGLFGKPATQFGTSFGSQTTASSGGLFGQPPAQTSTSGIFGQPAAQTSSSSVFGQPTTTTAGVFSATPTSALIFGGSTTPLFGSTNPVTTSAPLFGSTFVSSTTSAPAFGSSGFGRVSKPAFGKNTFGQPSSPFGQPTSGESGISDSLLFSGLGGQPSTEKANTNVFGSVQTFGGSPASSTENQQKQTSTDQAQPSTSISGIASTGTKGITSGLFGVKPSTAPGGIFVQPTSTESSFATSASSTKPVSGGVLGRMMSGKDNIGSAVPSAGGIFSQPANTSRENTFVLTATTTVDSGLYGQTPSSTTSSSVTVTSGTVSSTSNIIRQPIATTSSESTIIFGQPNSTSTRIFGTPSSTTSTGIFGQPPNTNFNAFGSKAETTGSTATAGLFGKPATQFGSSFGSQTTANSVNAGGLFGQPPAQTSTSGIFGQPPAQTSPSGVFGQPTTTTAGVFGATPTSAPIFRGSTTTLFGLTKPVNTSAPLFASTSVSSTTSAPAFGSSGFGGVSKPAFGQNTFGQPSSPFGQTTSKDSGISTSLLFSGLGDQPSTEKANTNVFWSVQTFGGSPASSTALFGSKATSGFGNAGTASTSPKTGGLFSSGGFTGGGVENAGSGVSQQQNYATLFGSQATSGFGNAGTASTSPKTGGLFSSGGFTGGGVGSAGSGVSQQQNYGFRAAPSFGGRPAFGSSLRTTPTFGSNSAFGGGASFGSRGTFGSPTGGAGSPGFAGFASSNRPAFGGSLAQNDAPTYGSLGQSTAPGFGSMGRGGSPATSGFGSAQGFGSSPSFGGGTSGSGNSGSTNMGYKTDKNGFRW